MVNEAQVRKALEGVMDPELHRSLIELGMVRQVRIGDGQVRSHLPAGNRGRRRSPLVRLWWARCGRSGSRSQAPAFVHSLDASVMLTGGMGGRAIMFFQQFGIEGVTGAYGTVRQSLERYLGGALRGAAPCKESQEHGHGDVVSSADLAKGEYEKDELGRLREEVEMLRQQLDMEIFLRVNRACIEKATFLTDGCSPTVACGSTLTQMVQGKSLAEATGFKTADLIIALDGLPPEHIHCATLAVNTLQQAIANCCPESDGLGE